MTNISNNTGEVCEKDTGLVTITLLNLCCGGG